MKCARCGNELSEESVFCNKCGNKIGVKPRGEFLTKKAKWYITTSLSVIAIVIAGIFWIDSIRATPVKVFKDAIGDSKYEDAILVYNKEIKGDLDKESDIEAFLNSDIEKIAEDFAEGKIDYLFAKNRLETISKTNLLSAKVSESQREVNNLNDSRIAFKNGNEFLKNDRFADALHEFKKVIKSDSNYTNAQTLISQASTDYKTTLINDAEKKASEEQFEEALMSINEALSIIPDDYDLVAKKAVYDKKNEEKKAVERTIKLQKAKEHQEVVVEKAGIIVQSADYKALYPDMIQVIVKNQFGKTVKNMIVASLAYDSNGLPLKIKTQFSFSNANFEFDGNAENVNIVPNGTFGKNNGWSLDESHGIKTVLSCVKEVDYYDGTKWENEYYDYWLEEYKEKPLH
ncbi:zinc ribbon domain-containing protein [Cohnella endophytica]|uniref:Zinc ribbon domain-containing protein n=1 Tax=Cohnella endophytica TaxID=2419778 RepID=A0A494XU73_9BACL|nr:zinc ribbon domain-containing protein [Cohnella endophytica]